MLTVSFNDVLYRAAEMAGRTRDRIATSELLMLQGFIAADLYDVWNRAAWPDLTPDPQQYTPVSGQVSKNEGAGPGLAPTGELGDVLGVWDRSPLQHHHARPLDWDEGNGTVRLEDPSWYWCGASGTVWIEAMLPVPVPDLMDIAVSGLAATTLPKRFQNYLSCRAAGMLLNTDQEGAGNGKLAQAERDLINQFNRLPRVWYREQVRVRRGPRTGRGHW